MPDASLVSLADQAAKRYGVDPGLYRRLINAESGWNPDARSGAGAVGLTQVVPKWHPNADLSTPQGQLDYGAKHLGTLLRNFGGDQRLALAAYNAGAGAVKKYGGIPPFTETQNYVEKILGGSSGAGAMPAMPATSSRGGIDPGLVRQLYGMAKTNARQMLGGKPVNQGRLAQMVDLVQEMRGVSTAGAGLADAGITPVLGAGAGGAAVSAAQSQLGTPYSWGGGSTGGPTKGIGRGAGTVGFDCSSLMQYAWAKSGVKLPRTTYDQVKVGSAVPSLEAAKPGDLLFSRPGPSGPEHVQMYLGNGQVLHAPRTGGQVEVRPIDRDYMAIRRPG